MKPLFAVSAVCIVILALVYGVGRDVLAAGAGAKSFAGSLHLGRIEQSFDMPAGYTARGELGKPRRFADTREQWLVPSHYGQIVQITAHGEDAVLWFQDGAGVVRNVKVVGVSQRLVRIEKGASTPVRLRRK